MKTEIIAIILGVYFSIVPWILGLVGLGKSVTIGISVFATMIFLDLALDEWLRREIEKVEGTDD